MRIAVCDDCREDLIQMKTYLIGHAVELFADVEEKKLSFDLYLLDIYIEGSINGIELAKNSGAGIELLILLNGIFWQ